jgi:DNA-binding response OmpR family regulator
MLRSPGTSTPVIVVMEKQVILIVEENALVRSANAERLRAAGFEVLEAANSADAELVLKSTAVDALFLPVRPR